MKRPRNRVKVGHRFINPDDLRFFRKEILRWWQHERRDFPWRTSRSALYQQIVAEVLLQRTRAETVAAFWPTFMVRFPNWTALSKASVRQIERVLNPIGLSRQRAPRLRALAKQMVRTHDRFPKTRTEIEQLPGVGQYIASAILMFQHSHAEPLLDVNMARVLERFFGPRKLADIRYDPYLQELSRLVIKGKRSRELNWAILDLAAAICRSTHPCVSRCPLRARCRYAPRISASPRPCGRGPIEATRFDVDWLRRT